MSKKFKVKHLEKLDNPQRREILPPEKIVKMLGLKPGQFIADVGCGIGYFTIPFAKAVTVEGGIFAIDISLEMLKETEKRVKEAGVTNVQLIQSAENNFKINEQSVDIVFTSTVYHEVDSPQLFLTECRRVLKKDGMLVILDWNTVKEDVGPPFEHRKGPEQVVNDLEGAGFKALPTEYIRNSYYIIKGIKE